MAVTAVGSRFTTLHAAQILVLSVAQYAIAFLASAIVARTLGPAGRGAYYLPLLTATTCVTVGKLGVDQANIFLHGTSRIPLRRLSAQNGLIAICSGLILVGVLACLPELVPTVFSGTPLALLLLAGTTIPLGIHAQLTGSLLAMGGDVRRQYVGNLISAIVHAVCALGLMWTGVLTVRTAVALSVVSAAVSWGVIAQALTGNPANWIGFDIPLLKTTLTSALVLHIGMILFFLHLRIDMYMVEAWLGAAALGQYSISVTLAETLMLATDAVAVAILPTQMGNTIREAAERALRAARLNGLLGFALACTAATGGSFAVRLLFGKAYDPAVVPMLLLLPGIVSLGMQRVCGAPALRAGRPGAITGIYSMTLATNILLNILWIPRLGLAGAALASTTSYILGALVLLMWTSRLAHLPLTTAVRFEASDFSTAASAARNALAMLGGVTGRSQNRL